MQWGERKIKEAEGKNTEEGMGNNDENDFSHTAKMGELIKEL
jgi:hypothetical protein